MSDHMNNGSHSESACRAGQEFIIITVHTLQQSSHLTLCSLSRDVYKNAWMNSTLKTIPNKWFYWSVVSPHNYLRGVELWIVLMDHGQACRLVLTDDNMIVQLFRHNKSETKCCTPRCQEQRSQLQSLSSPVNFQPIRFRSIAFHLKPNFCYLQRNIFTTPMFSFTSVALDWLYTTSALLYELRLTRCRRQSNGPYWLSISQPSCPRPRRWRKAVLGSQCSMFSFRETPAQFCSHYPWARVCASPLHNSTPQPKVRGQVLLKSLFISSFRVYFMYHHAQCFLGCVMVNPSACVFSCPMTAWKESVIYSESKEEGLIPTSAEGNE